MARARTQDLLTARTQDLLTASCLLVQALISLLDGEGTVLVEAKSHVRSYSGFLHGAISVDSY